MRRSTARFVGRSPVAVAQWSNPVVLANVNSSTGLDPSPTMDGRSYFAWPAAANTRLQRQARGDFRQLRRTAAIRARFPATGGPLWPKRRRRVLRVEPARRRRLRRPLGAVRAARRPFGPPVPVSELKTSTRTPPLPSPATEWDLLHEPAARRRGRLDLWTPRGELNARSAPRIAPEPTHPPESDGHVSRRARDLFSSDRPVTGKRLGIANRSARLPVRPPVNVTR